MFYATFKQSEVDELVAASTLSTSSIGVTVTATALRLNLTKVVAVTNYKALANLGRKGLASFDSYTRSTTIPLRDKAGFKPDPTRCGANVLSDGDGGYVYADACNDCAVIVGMSYAEKDTILKLVRRLAGAKKKTYTTTKDAAKARQVKAARTRAAQAASTNDEVWSHDEGDFVLADEGWRR